MDIVEKENNHSQIFWPKPNKFMTFIFPIVLVVLIIGNGVNAPGGLSMRGVIIALVVGLVVFLFMFAITPRAKVSVENNQIFYRNKSLNLDQLAAVEAFTRVYLFVNALTASFKLQLIDHANNRLTIPLGNWVDQEILLSIIGNYAAKSGATFNKQAANLIEKAKQG